MLIHKAMGASSPWSCVRFGAEFLLIVGAISHLHVHLLHEVAKSQCLPIGGHCSARSLLVVHVYRAFLQLLQPKLPAFTASRAQHTNPKLDDHTDVF